MVTWSSWERMLVDMTACVLLSDADGEPTSRCFRQLKSTCALLYAALPWPCSRYSASVNRKLQPSSGHRTCLELIRVWSSSLTLYSVWSHLQADSTAQEHKYQPNKLEGCTGWAVCRLGQARPGNSLSMTGQAQNERAGPKCGQQLVTNLYSEVQIHVERNGTLWQ